jgi:hypothetical protein
MARFDVFRGIAKEKEITFSFPSNANAIDMGVKLWIASMT